MFAQQGLFHCRLCDVQKRAKLLLSTPSLFFSLLVYQMVAQQSGQMLIKPFITTTFSLYFMQKRKSVCTFCVNSQQKYTLKETGTHTVHGASTHSLVSYTSGRSFSKMGSRPLRVLRGAGKFVPTILLLYTGPKRWIEGKGLLLHQK